jgi:LAGLIDADG DNA endonuclease family/NADH-Ubiquinone oxidoreductase (complex I), chain 5 N-terminus
MYLAIILLPFVGAILSGFFGRIIGVKGSYVINVSCLFITTVLAFAAFYEVAICKSTNNVELFSWVSSEMLRVNWSFYYDELTVSMLIPVLIVSLLVHLYSVGYMGEDPHVQRFFSYISLFTGLMLILVTADNFLVMFVGWEGFIKCLRWYNIINNYFKYLGLILFYAVLLAIFNFSYKIYVNSQVFKKYLTVLVSIKSKGLNIQKQRYFFTLSSDFNNLNKNNNKLNRNNRKLTSYERIGPHNIDIISIIVGSTLGDSHLEKRKRGIGTRVKFEQCSKNTEYLMWFHKYLSSRGYCTIKEPVLRKRIREKGVILYHYVVNSYTFSSFNWLHDMFYTLDISQNKYIKIVPLNLEEYLTPLALAIWFMDDGSICGSSVKIATNCFTDKEILFLCYILKKKYNIICSKMKDGRKKGCSLYIYKSSLPIFSCLIKPYMLPSMYYKLNNY